MKTQKSKTLFQKSLTINEQLKKQLGIQRDATKKYLQMKKSASQPAYFLNQSRLKKLSDIYRAVSLDKLIKNKSINPKSRSFHNSITPQKKTTLGYNGTFKKAGGYGTINMNRVFQTTQKTKRLTLNRNSQQMNRNSQQLNNTDNGSCNNNKILLDLVDKLQIISNITIEKSFHQQYTEFFKQIVQDGIYKKGNSNQTQNLLAKFCSLIQYCQTKIDRLKEKQIKSKYQKIQMDFSATNTQLKKKSFKLQLLIKQIDQLKQHNMKISKELKQLRQQKKTLKPAKKRLQISNIYQILVINKQAQLTTPIYQLTNPKNLMQKYEFLNDSQKSQSKQIQLKRLQQQTSIPKKSQKLQMIKKIRSLQKKQIQLTKTLLLLRADGIDIEKAYQQVITGQDNISIDQSQTIIQIHNKVSKHVRHINNTDQYQADNSIVSDMDGLSINYYQGEPSEDYIQYPIKQFYKSKNLSQSMQQRLKLDFDVLYEDYQYYQEQQSQSQNNPNPPTI